MNLQDRIKAFAKLGAALPEAIVKESSLIKESEIKNLWFTEQNIKSALAGIAFQLEEKKLIKWLAKYPPFSDSQKTIALTMAGNIPLVGFHDYLCVLITGHKAQIKLSSQDEVLMSSLNTLLLSLEPRFSNRIEIVEKLKSYDAAIATGSDNTGRYFEYYFRNVPHIIRKNRSSCAVLIGGETEEELNKLGDDVFSYFGLGCRNISKLYIPEEYDLVPLLRNWESFLPVMDHHKYANNYTYQRSILLVNHKHFYDNGAIVLLESDKLVSPIGVVYFEKYADQSDLKSKIDSHAEKIQCIVSAKGWYNGSTPFGQAQLPEVWDYADGVDTIQFLSQLN